MEKKKYVKPVLETEEFIPQEYIAACEFIPINAFADGGTGLAYLKPADHPDGYPLLRVGNVNMAKQGGGPNGGPLYPCPTDVTRDDLQKAVLGIETDNTAYDSKGWTYEAGLWGPGVNQPIDGYVLKGVDGSHQNNTTCFYVDNENYVPGMGGNKNNS